MHTGGGVIGCSTAYFLTRHAFYDPKFHSITILEATEIAGGASGKGSGLLADWATPKCLAPLSFKIHAALASEHGGESIWGYRNVHCAELETEVPDIYRMGGSFKSVNSTKFPSELDWLLPDIFKSYDGLSNGSQVNPYMFTKTLAALAEEKGANIIIGSATAIDFKEDGQGIKSVQYTQNGNTYTLPATDILLSAGPWTPRLFPRVHLMTPRSHSVVVKPSRTLSPYVLFPRISPTRNNNWECILLPEIYPRPGDLLHDFSTVYACGPDDYDVPLPDTSDAVAVDKEECDVVWQGIRSISKELHDGKMITKQACYKPQIRPHQVTEPVGPIVGPTGIEGPWLATGHDEWGIQNAPGTGLVMSEMIFEGKARSADCKSLDPKHFLKKD